MSEHSITIVPRISTVKNKAQKIKDILEWLSSNNIIQKQQTICISESDNCVYPIEDGAKRIVKEPQLLPFDIHSNGLEITTKRTIFTTYEAGLDQLICPNCKNDISGEDWDYFNEWASAKSNNITCPICKQGNEIHKFDFNPVWGFSDLGFTFLNWPEFKESFIEAFENKLGIKVDVVFAHL